MAIAIFKERKISGVLFDWHVINKKERCNSFTAGLDCVQISYHSPKRDGDKHYCDVLLKDDSSIRIFNLNSVIWEPWEKN